MCDNLPNCDLEKINNTLLSDKRILINKTIPKLANYLVPGIGFGGSCFPKDVEGIIKTLKNKKINNSFLKSIININDESMHHGFKIISKNFKKNSKICILGASFKENSDDTRKSRTLYVADKLKKLNIDFQIIDPKVKKLGKYKCIPFNEQIVKKYKNFILMTKWKNFKNLYKKYFTKKIKILDFRRFFEKKKFKSKHVHLVSVGYSSLI